MNTQHTSVLNFDNIIIQELTSNKPDLQVQETLIEMDVASRFELQQSVIPKLVDKRNMEAIEQYCTIMQVSFEDLWVEMFPFILAHLFIAFQCHR
jgi:hypothetical protein